MRGRFLAAVALLICGAQAIYADESQTRPPDEGYVLHCSGCHGLSGEGVPGTTPTLHGIARLARTPAGRAYLARVPGVAQAPIGDAELAVLLNWVLKTFSNATPIPAYSAVEIGTFRREPLRSTSAARAALDTREWK